MSESNPQVEQLVKEGVEAAKAGDRSLARGKLETAVKLDPYNEKAWFWLARVVETDEERRTCLGNVILINPGNQRAQEMLAKLEGSSSAGDEGGGTIAGFPRRTVLLVGAGMGIMVVLLCLVLVFSGGGGDEAAVATAGPTETPSETPTETPDVAASQTVQALITPSAVPIDINSIPTWTPTPTQTNTPAPEAFPTPPPDVPGQIVMQTRRFTGDDFNQPIGIIRPADVNSLQIVSPPDTRGQNPVFSSDGRRIAWALFLPGQRTNLINFQVVGANELIGIVTLYDVTQYRILAPNEPAWSGSQLVFTGQLLGQVNRDLWLLDASEASLAPTAIPTFGPPPTATPTASPTIAPTIDPLLTPSPTPEGMISTEPGVVPPPDSPLQRLTQGEANAAWPAFSPNGNQVVYVGTQQQVTDLRVVSLDTRTISALTFNANALIEAMPDWGSYQGVEEIIFSGSTGVDQPSDIYILRLDGASEPEVLFDFGPQDIKPRFSPDGRYIVFASDQNGNWDTFIYDRQTEEIYGLVVDPNSIDLPNDWIQ